MNAVELEKYIKECIEAYYKGTPLISDLEYDSLIEDLEN